QDSKAGYDYICANAQGAAGSENMGPGWGGDVSMKRQTLYLAAWAAAAMPAALSAGPASGVYYDIQAQAVSGPGSQNVRGAFTPQTARPPAAPSQLPTSPLTVTLAVYTDNRGTSAMDLLVPFAPGV